MEAVVDGERDHLSVDVLESTVLAIACNKCTEPPNRLVAEVDHPMDDGFTPSASFVFPDDQGAQFVF